MGRPTRSQIVVVLLSSLVAVGLAELVCRVALPRPGFQPDGVHSTGLVVPHPTRYYAFRPSYRTTIPVGGRTITIRFDALGLRDGPIDVGDHREERILALGDSFTAGAGVEAEESWPEQLESRLHGDPAFAGVRVIDAGVSGYGMRQIRLLGEELVPLLEPRLLVVGVYAMAADRVEDPFVFLDGTIVQLDAVEALRRVDGGFLSSPFSRPWARSLDFWLDRHFQLGAHLAKVVQRLREGPPPRRELDASAAKAWVAPLLGELDRIRSLSASRSLPLVLLLVNVQGADGRFARREHLVNAAVEAYARERGIPWVDPLPELERRAGGQPVFRISGDFHWTPAAHAVAGRALANDLEARCHPPGSAARPGAEWARFCSHHS